MNKANQNNKKRIFSIDLIRAVAIILMVLAHTIAFIYSGDNKILHFFHKFGNTICFTVFLLASGASTYLAYIDSNNWKQKRKNLIRRTFSLLLGYYIVATVSSFNQFDWPPSGNWLETLSSIFIFIKVPGYTEFLVTFILLSLVTVFFHKQLKALADNFIILLVFSLLFYFYGSALYHLELDSPALFYKSLFAGHQDWYRFPLFQYLPIFLIGLYIGKILRNKHYEKLLKITALSLVFTLASLLSPTISAFPYSDNFQRWPPTLSFLSLGTSFGLILLMLSNKVEYVAKDVFQLLSRNALKIFIWHISILQIFHLVFKTKTNSGALTILCFITLIVVSTFLSIKSFKTLIEKALKEKYFTVLVLIIIISTGGVFWSLNNLLPTTDSNALPTVKGLQTKVNPHFSSKINRNWILKDSNIDKQKGQLIFTLETYKDLNIQQLPSYQVENTNIVGQLTQLNAHTFQKEIEISTLQPGKYKIYSNFYSNEKKYATNPIEFHISYPLYVILTVDWEGSDTENYQLSKLTELSEKHYNMPLTHFFNPRIYITESIPTSRVDYLTSWVLERQLIGDEIGLHLHMNYEVVKAADVEVIKQPKWTDFLETGHDVPCSEYSKEDFSKILSWSKTTFTQNGLPVPTSFRAGGWFADLSTLQALEENGFNIDSSGREFYYWGNNGLKGHWNLSSTTQPYKPSKSNQNAASPYPTFNLWEFPNNGGDSYMYKTKDLIDKFEKNYDQAILQKPVVVTYLTHPHAFTQDYEVLDPLFEHTDKFNIANDTGPVIYTTLEKAYQDMQM